MNVAWSPDNIRNQDDRVAVVTGANGGLGLHRTQDVVAALNSDPVVVLTCHHDIGVCGPMNSIVLLCPNKRREQTEPILNGSMDQSKRLTRLVRQALDEPKAQ